MVHRPTNTEEKSTTALPSSLRDPSKLFYQQNSIKRSILVAYWSVIILALPLWWYTTSIERLSLPSSRVHAQAQLRLSLPVRICLPTNDQKLTGQLRDSLRTHIEQQKRWWMGLDLHVVGKESCGGDEQYYQVVPSDGQPTVLRRNLSFPFKDISSIPALSETLADLLVPYAKSQGLEHRVAQYSPRYRLAFSLLNEDAAVGAGVTGWNVQDAVRRYIYPITHRLSTLHNFTIESQVQFHAPLAFAPQVLHDNMYGLTPEDLTVFINSAEWTLSSSASNDPVLHFILFIPSSTRRPLKILDVSGSSSSSNAFLLPQWGGIVIHNPSLDDSNSDLSTASIDQVFTTFSNQLLALLGVPALPSRVERASVESNTVLLSDWQLDALLRRRALENAAGAQDTLLSIIKLVDQIENMPVHEDVRGDVEDALAALDKTYTSAQTKPLSDTFRYSADALSLASRAFFNPGMLALLYFPAEHKYAVYTPLFASTVIPLMVAALREIFSWRTERRARVS